MRFWRLTLTAGQRWDNKERFIIWHEIGQIFKGFPLD